MNTREILITVLILILFSLVATSGLLFKRPAIYQAVEAIDPNELTQGSFEVRPVRFTERLFEAGRFFEVKRWM